LFCKTGTDISISKISRPVSREFNLKSYKPAAKLRLTSAMKKEIIFFQLTFSLDCGKWRKFLFFDKSTIQRVAARKEEAR